MRLGEIDLNLKPLKPKFYLCKPDKTVIASLNHIYDTSLSVKLGKVNELDFTIPVLIESDHEQVENPLIEKIRHRYLVKMEYNHQTEYFVFLDQNKQFDETNEKISYKLYGLGYLLGDKQIRDYEATSKTLLEIVNEVLEFTNWQVGHMDSYFNRKFRSHEISSQTVLQAIYELAEKFSAIIIWDTVGLKIDFHMPVNIGMNRGLKFKEGKYLESFSVNSNAEEMVTRLKVYGKDGLTFRRLSPTGANYIESFDWYIYPFERDASQNIIAHSDYFSDSLCIALENYGLAVASVQGQFDTLTASLTAKQDEIQQAEQRLTTLKSELTQILDELDISNSDEFSIPSEHSLIIERRHEKELQIMILRTSIALLKAQQTQIQEAINNLRIATLISNHLSPANLIELNDFIIEKEYTNDTIVDEEDLLEDGLRAFNEMREPKVSMSLDIINFLSVVEAQYDWHKLSLGDIVKLESKRLRIGIEAKIIEINYNFETDSISLTIANEKELKDDYRKLLDLIYSANATSTAVSMDKFRWDMIEEANTLIDELYLGTINTIKNNIIAGYQQNIEVSERGIIIKSPQDPLKQLVIQNGVLALSNNGGNTWSHAITSSGIVGETIIGRLIMGSRLIIEDEDGIIRFTGSLQEIFDENNNLKLAIGNYAPGKYGIKIDSGSLLISSGNSSVNLVDTWNNAEQNSKDYTDGKDTALRNNLRLTAPLQTSLTLDANGITAYTNTPNKFARLDYRGLYIQGGAIQIDGGLPDNQISSSSDWNKQGTYIDGSGIYTGIIQATQIKAETLDAITANLGTINAGTLNLSEGLKLVNGNNTVLSVDKGQVVLNVSNATVNQKNIIEEIDKKASLEHLEESANTILENISEELKAKIGEDVFEELKNNLDGEFSLIKNDIGSIVVNASNVLTKITETEEFITELGTFRNEVISYMDFSAKDMLVIGKSSSPFKIKITNEQISFLNNDTVLAYMNGNTLYINKAEIKDSILIGKHLMQADNTGTIFRWAGV